MSIYVKDGKSPNASSEPSHRVAWGGVGLIAPTLIVHGFATPAALPLNSAYVALSAGRITAVSVRGTSAPIVDIRINTAPVIVGIPVSLLNPVPIPPVVAPGDLIEAFLAAAAGASDVVVELLIKP